MRFARNKMIAILVAVTAFSLLTDAFAFNPAGGQNRADDQQAKPKLSKPQQANPRDQEPQDRDDAPIKLGTALVVLDVTAVDQSNKPVMDLTQENFQVLEDKVPQKIDFFSREQVPVSVVFAIDTSGSMRAKLDTVIKASAYLVKESRQGDEMAVIEFKDQPELLQEFTGDTADVIDTLQGLIASRQTAMLDALYLGADYAS
ncbi:MAG TPA: VWA domain-containing protein, partial [Blastocatellia bacterium]|nr:VWA domain-containing protein [Blastocatellia bacterium]